MLKDDYERAAEFTLNVLAEIERNYGSGNLTGIAHKARIEIADRKDDIMNADKAEDSRMDLRAMLSACDEALGVIEGLPAAVRKEGASSTSPKRYKDLCKLAGEVLQSIGHLVDPPTTTPVDVTVNRGLEKLKQLGNDYVPADNLRVCCQQFRAMLAAVSDSASSFERGKFDYFRNIHSSIYHWNLIDAVVELITKIEASYINDIADGAEVKSALTLAKIDLAKERERWKPINRGDYTQVEYHMILQKACDLIDSIDKSKKKSSPAHANNLEFKQDCSWLAERVKEVINQLCIDHYGMLKGPGTESRGKLNTLAEGIGTAYSDSEARAHFCKIMQEGIDFMFELKKEGKDLKKVPSV
jgi:hypothetical protein